MMQTHPRYGPAIDVGRLKHIEHLLRRYPAVDDAERNEILHYLRKGPALDTALLTGLDGIAPQLDRFRQDHRRQLGLGPKEYLVVGAILVFLILFADLISNAGAG